MSGKGSKIRKKKKGKNWVKAEDILKLPKKKYLENIKFLAETKAGMRMGYSYLHRP